MVVTMATIWSEVWRGACEGFSSSVLDVFSPGRQRRRIGLVNGEGYIPRLASAGGKGFLCKIIDRTRIQLAALSLSWADGGKSIVATRGREMAELNERATARGARIKPGNTKYICDYEENGNSDSQCG